LIDLCFDTTCGTKKEKRRKEIWEIKEAAWNQERVEDTAIFEIWFLAAGSLQHHIYIETKRTCMEELL
jgi:hypothetical protein